MNDPARVRSPSPVPVGRAADMQPVDVAALEGKTLPAPMRIASLLVGQEANLMWDLGKSDL